MSGILELERLLSEMNPELIEDEFVFCTVSGSLAQYIEWGPLASFNEKEGLTLVLTKDIASREGLQFKNTYKQITLTVHSSLEAVGLTASVSNKLASKGISANVIAAYFHDHIFVQSEKAREALIALKEVGKNSL
ncbi:ACT domain-containing protein [Microbulbifer sp. TRSA007]|uniref:ACT domain-containing protein n=1 Tax=Microbulbifer sp. TRSA007 TaxID=3243384 RepID=UPI00403A5475